MKSRVSSVENVKQFFLNTSEDVISLEEAYVAWGRDITKEAENKAWLSNKLTALKHYKLVRPVYDLKNKKRVLEKIQLTTEGKRALGKIEEDGYTENENSNGHRAITLEDVMKVIPALRQRHPEFEITFDIKLKDSVGSSGAEVIRP